MEPASAGELVKVASGGPQLDGIVFDTPSRSKVVVAVVEPDRGPVFRTVHPNTLTERTEESHTICAVVTAEFLEHQQRIGNDLITPVPEYRFPGLAPGDRWCVTAVNWLRAHEDGAAAFVVLASTHERALEIVPLAALREHAVDVPHTPGPPEK